MDVLTFISNLVSSLAWPSAAILALYILRKPVIELVPLLRKLKYKELELEFSEVLDKIKADQEPEISEKLPSNDRLDKYSALLEVAPNAAISEAWADLEKIITECGLRHHVSALVDPTQTSLTIAKILKEKDVIGKSQFKAFDELRTLRNNLVHSNIYNISKRNAAEYVAQASLLMLNIEKQ